MNPTHLRIHPDTFKKVLGDFWQGQHDPVGATKEIKVWGLTVWLDKSIKENEVEFLDIGHILDYLRNRPIFNKEI